MNTLLRRTPLTRSVTVGLASLAMAVAGTAVLPAAPAQSVPADPSCPPAADIDLLAAGQPVDGLTVSEGTTPDTFTGEVVGVLPNGIAAGLDMVIVKLSGSVITDPVTGAVDRGIWEGMSGSPVYDADGNLIGAVSYGLAYSPSEYAGVTPAEDMYAIQGHMAAKRHQALKVLVSGAVARRMKADKGLSDKAVQGGFRRLPMPFAVSGGLSTKKVREIARRGGLNPKRFVTGVGAGATAVPIPVEAGGNLVGSAAYGDVDLTGTGTATAVCDGNVIGFGHPFLFSGGSDLTMHGANALYIQRGGFDPSFKVSVPGAPIGAIVEDRLAGILGQVGATPPTTTIESDLTSLDTGQSRQGTTYATSQNYLGYATALHTYQNLLSVFDAVGPGSAELSWTIDLTTDGGKTLSMTRSSKFVSRWSAAEEPVYGLWNDVERILNNRYEPVTLDDVEITGNITEEINKLKITGVQHKVRGSWVEIKKRARLNVEAGSTLKLRVVLEPSGASTATAQKLPLSLAIPAKAKGSGEVFLAGNGFDPNRGSTAKTLKQYLDHLSARPGNETVSAELRLRRPSADVVGSGTAQAVVDGRWNFDVRVKK